MKGLKYFQRVLKTDSGEFPYFSIPEYLQSLGINPDKLPYSIRVLVENALHSVDGFLVTEENLKDIANWKPKPKEVEIPYMPIRVVLQDFTGVPVVVDLAAMRDAMKELGGDPKRINPVIQSDLVIDHSVQVDYFGTGYAYVMNVKKELERNRERYQLLKWAQKSFKNFRVVPTGTGIIHQVNLEYFAKVVYIKDGIAVLDTLLGTDSHTTMINGIGVLGWGVGGIEAEAVMLGQPYYMLLPEVVGVRLVGELPEGSTATDLVLTITEVLRKKGVVGKFVEYFGPALKNLSVPDRATIANMAPEYGSTCGYFPIDERTLEYLRGTGRDEELVKLVEVFAKEQGIFWTPDSPEPEYSDVVEIDLSKIEPSVAGPKRPQDRIPLKDLKKSFYISLEKEFGKKPFDNHQKDAYESEGGLAVKSDVAVIVHEGEEFFLTHGSVVIAAITSCTNTSNPSVMIGAGLVAKKAVERGLTVKPYIKTSLAPGSGVVTDYLRESGLLPYLEALRFHVVGYGCTTCIGNSGPLPKKVEEAIKEYDLVVASVLSGNRNFEARIHPLVKANYLASPMLVVAFALAGRVDIDFENEPLGYDPNGEPVYLRDIWPSQREIREYIEKSLNPEMFRKRYADVFEGDEYWKSLDVKEGETFEWDPNSTYIKKPPYFENFSLEVKPPEDIKGAYVLVVGGDSVTTDHISPAGSIHPESPAGKYLIESGVKPSEFNSYGSRRGNHEVMMRGTFANVRFRNYLFKEEVRGWWTIYIPTGEKMSVYDAAMRYKSENIPLIILAGKEYGTGSSRDWAAKGTALLGVKAVIAESFERIHRSNLVGMGVLPLQFKEGENMKTLGLTGFEKYDIIGIKDIYPRKTLKVIAHKPDGGKIEFEVIARLDTPVEVEYYKHGGILPYVLRKIYYGELS
ncbi:MAG: aconitate hydratase AcnA [candidate division WOR-3 bacterium]